MFEYLRIFWLPALKDSNSYLTVLKTVVLTVTPNAELCSHFSELCYTNIQKSFYFAKRSLKDSHPSTNPERTAWYVLQITNIVFNIGQNIINITIGLYPRSIHHGMNIKDRKQDTNHNIKNIILLLFIPIFSELSNIRHTFIVFT